MAFATTNYRRGTMGDLKVTAGDWTGSLGDASGTVTVEGSRIYSAEFNTNDATGPNQNVPFTWTASAGLITITVHNREASTTGTYIVIHA